MATILDLFFMWIFMKLSFLRKGDDFLPLTLGDAWCTAAVFAGPPFLPLPPLPFFLDAPLPVPFMAQADKLSFCQLVYPDIWILQQHSIQVSDAGDFCNNKWLSSLSRDDPAGEHKEDEENKNDIIRYICLQDLHNFHGIGPTNGVTQAVIANFFFP